jgi:hypothetical protein
MRAMTIAAALVAAACGAPAPAGAQSGDAYAGTWAFQTEPYTAASGAVAAVMSGVAIISANGGEGYAIRLLSHEYVTQGAQSVMLTARQTCRGEVQGAQFNISCEMAEPLEGYTPDNFVLQAGEADQLLGVLASGASAQVTFSRVR